MLKSVCNDDENQCDKHQVLISFIQCETSIVIAKQMLKFRKSIVDISTNLIVYKSDFSKLVKQDIKTARDIFLKICQIGSIIYLNIW